MYVPSPIVTLTQAGVRSELAVVIGQEVMPILKLVAMELCEGCKAGLDVGTHGHMHDTCNMVNEHALISF